MAVVVLSEQLPLDRHSMQNLPIFNGPSVSLILCNILMPDILYKIFNSNVMLKCACFDRFAPP